mmetsp:Transcript_15899/g.28905  ORF Transcript_15899/g.28905 Transcript_15899/m.28905 type:complete len:180 (-) Transcript_15899:111-650(-)
MMSKICVILAVTMASSVVQGFAPPSAQRPSFTATTRSHPISALHSVAEDKAAPLVTGEELELMMTEWDEPLVVDAYATWCGPCLLMAPEFEAAAQELKGRVRFCKLDTDLEPDMAGRLNIMGLPTVLFLDKFEPKEGQEGGGEQARAMLKDRIEGAIRKDSIIALCEHHFFGGPMPEQV